MFYSIQINGRLKKIQINGTLKHYNFSKIHSKYCLVFYFEIVATKKISMAKNQKIYFLVKTIFLTPNQFSIGK